MENVEVPEYFTCPISLQIMKDPVTAISGITYDRESIEHWLYNNHNTICPVTNQPLPQNSDLTPNHTLRRLIQSWCTLYAVDRIPTPKTPLSKFRLINLLKDLRVPTLRLQTLNKLEAHATDSDRNRVHMVEAGVAKSLLNIIVSCYRKEEISSCLEGALNVLYLIRVPLIQSGSGLPGNDEVVDSLTWVLGLDCFGGAKTAAYTLKIVVKFNPRVLERLNRVFFQTMSRGLQRGGVGVNAILHVLLEACAWGRNRGMMIESGTIFDVIELELRESDNRRTTEMVLGIVYHLCSCADGRAQLLGHAAGMAAVTRRILKVSATADDRAVLIIWLIAKYSATSGVLAEMLRVGSVAKMCVVIQADREAHLKEKAREILRMHFDVWKNSPCVEIATFTRYMK